MNWYVLTCQSGQENSVRTLLEEKGFWVYLPTGIKTYFHRRKKVHVTEFYNPFTGYMFVLVDERDGPWKDIAECGARVLKIRKKPVKIEEEVIGEVLQAEECGLFDRHRGSQKKMHPFGLGQEVKLNFLGSEIRGYIKKLKGTDKVVVDAERYGRKVQAEVSASQLAQI